MEIVLIIVGTFVLAGLALLTLRRRAAREPRAPYARHAPVGRRHDRHGA